ncbi:DeoR/GlpR family DNA-binding transcription regulator [Goodfellowiella coeruleoviolacea]|uniref:Transcriptional regulator, DeoR family n=1 Tax=Goodfellowiella coeruleoviolacea TaxID=334858 RepID=A0AAE3GL06_9PSEU|nr:DeoR/GlpR family DNA-binding transcription regulator [Goodfellowiella coeruleoviolacea]MCP2169455.1 transcriptional regulator, DeoR family [Goodfellowiella coeruleoviolacea]
MILRALRERDRVPVTVLAELTGCSEMTIRRDLDVLERDGCLRRVRGAAVNMLTGEETPFPLRARQQVEAKRRLGAAVAGMLDDGETVVLDSGTTTLEVARSLADRRLTVLPLSLHGADALRPAERVRLVLPGGDLRAGELTFVGPLTEYALNTMRFDTVVLGCCGLTVRDGVTAHDLVEAQVKKAAVAASARVIAVLDHAKLVRTAFARVCAVAEVDVVVTDRDAPADQVDQLRQAGVEVHCV